MKSKTPENYRSSSVSKSRSATKQYTEEKTIERQVLPLTPSKNHKNYLTDEIWDIFPKTGYTYAQSGSYSPRFFGKKYTWPNMSRYRIRDNRRGQETAEEEFSDEGEEIVQNYDDDIYEDDFDERSSNISYETVLEDGISLRSGKSLQLMKEYLHEYDRDEEMPSTSVRRSSTRDNRVRNTEVVTYDIYSTSKKLIKSQQNTKQVSMSEQKTRSRDQVGISNGSDKSKQSSDLYRRQTISTYYNDYGSTSHSSDSVNTDNRYVNNTSVRKTLEFDQTDSGVKEKAALEISEKVMKSKDKKTTTSLNHLYAGLDSGESDTELSDSGSGYNSTLSTDYNYNGIRRSRGQGQKDVSMSTTTTTVVTTITETFKRFSNPVIEQSWNYIGQPAWTYIGLPLWSYILHPVLSVISTVVLSVWEFLFSETGVAGPSYYISSALMWILRRVESFVMQFILLDVWLLSRKRYRGCCFCLPIILLCPFLIALASNQELWSGSIFGNSSSLSFSYFDRPTPNIPENVPFDKQEFFTQLNQEVKVWLLQHHQLQSANQLSEADVEAIVYRILQKELTLLRNEMALSAAVSDTKENAWKKDHEDRIEHINKQYNSLLMAIQNLESSVSQQKGKMATKVNSDFSQHSLNLAGLEEKLLAQKVKLEDLEKEFGGVLLKIKDCCHNETYYGVLVRDGVEAALNKRMAGYASGTSQDAFSQWLGMNFVNQDHADSKLKSLEAALRADVMAMINAIEQKQKQFNLELQQLQEEKPVKKQLQEEKPVNKQYTINTGTGVGLDEQRVKLLIEAALLRYSADRIGIPDYALESAGGTVVSTRCSQTYYRKSALLSVFGIPLWYTYNSPRTIIQPEVLPGQCWAFVGSQGYIVIQTSTVITPSGFTLEHIPKMLSPAGQIDTAPKDFTVIGLETENDQNGMSLGNYTYTDDDQPLQYFNVQVSPEKLKSFHLYELRILNNHGNLHLTCLYRFRIHGKPIESA